MTTPNPTKLHGCGLLLISWHMQAKSKRALCAIIIVQRFLSVESLNNLYNFGPYRIRLVNRDHTTVRRYRTEESALSYIVQQNVTSSS